MNDDLQEILALNRQPASANAPLKIDESLHEYLIEKSQNPYIREFFERQGRYYRILFRWEDHDRQAAIDTIDQHREILSALLAQQWEEARRALSHHIRCNHPILSTVTSSGSKAATEPSKNNRGDTMIRLLPIRLLLLGMLVCFQAPGAAAERVDYLTQVKPILAEKCYSCHGALKQEAELRLETRSLLMKGGDSGAVLVEGNAARSLILERIQADEDERMPPAEEGSALKPDEVALIRAWIDQGATAPQEEIPLAPHEHWAFQRIKASRGSRR